MLRRALLTLALTVPAAIVPAATQDPGVQERAIQERDAAIHARFFESQGSHFRILFEGPQDYPLASRALEVLEEAYFRIGSALYTFPDRTITVVLYTQQQFQDVTRAPAWAAASYDGTIRVPIRGALAMPEELARVLSHELAHAVIQAIAPRGVPAWLHEGLAVSFEPNGTARADADLAASTSRLPFTRLVRGFQGLSAAQARLAYAQSAVAARRLLDEAGGPALVAILTDLADGVPFERAFEQRLFLPYETFIQGPEPGR